MILVSCFLPDSAWAWGPATHLHYGMAVLARVSELSDALRVVLSSQSLPFLYGCISADIVLAKKFGRALTHCHKWENGLQLVSEAKTPRTQAFALGYVAHLAADTISHNCFVPSKTIESYETKILKHMYWELRFDRCVTTKKTVKLFQEIAQGDFSDCDEHMENLVPTRILDFAFNKQVFNHLLLLQGLRRWQKLWDGISQASRFPLSNSEVSHFSHRSIKAVMSFLKDQEKTEFRKADPRGEKRLKAAKELRQHYRKCLREKRAPNPSHVLKAVKQFAQEPFGLICIEDLKAA